MLLGQLFALSETQDSKKNKILKEQYGITKHFGSKTFLDFVLSCLVKNASLFILSYICYLKVSTDTFKINLELLVYKLPKGTAAQIFQY